MLRLAASVAVIIAAVTAAPSRAVASSGPELFADGVISTRDDELGLVLAPDGRTAYFVKRSPTTNTPPRSVICMSHLMNGRWSEPEVAPFSGMANDFGVTVSADGRRIIFTSDRSNGSPDTPKNFDLWLVERDGEHWSEPRNLGAPINTPGTEAYPSLAADGTLYFSATRAGGKGGPDIYRARWLDDHFGEPENLAEINSPGYESQPAIAPDQSLLVFTSSDREDTLKGEGAPYSRSDLYVSFREGGHWSAPRHLGPPINTAFNELTPSISPDGRWLFFASDRGFASVPMARRLSTREFETALHGTLDDWDNVYRVGIEAVTSLRDAETKQGGHR